MVFEKNSLVILYSPKNSIFHVETVLDMAKKNVRTFMEDGPSDWITLGFAESREEADEQIEMLRTKKEEHQEKLNN